MGVGRMSQHSPKCVLNAATGRPYRVIHAIASSFCVGFYLSPEGLSHLIRADFDRIYLRHFNQSLFYGPSEDLPRTSGKMIVRGFISMPRVL
jgi:hypothetical protein